MRVSGFRDGFNLRWSAKERLEFTLGSLVVEASELAGLTKSELSDLQAYLVQSVESRVRLAYAHDAQSFTRKHVMVGTTNSTQPIPLSGSSARRFIVIECGRECSRQRVEGYLSEETLGQLYAEARDSRIPLRFSDADERAQAQANKDYFDIPYREIELVRKYLQKHFPGPVTMSDLIEAVMLGADEAPRQKDVSEAVRKYQRPFTSYLRQCDWVPKRVREGALIKRVWVPGASGKPVNTIGDTTTSGCSQVFTSDLSDDQVDSNFRPDRLKKPARKRLAKQAIEDLKSYRDEATIGVNTRDGLIKTAIRNITREDDHVEIRDKRLGRLALLRIGSDWYGVDPGSLK